LATWEKETSPQWHFSILDDDLRVTVKDALKSDVHLRMRMCGLKTALPGMAVFEKAVTQLHEKWNAWLVVAWGTGDQEGQGDQMPKVKTRSRKRKDLAEEAIKIACSDAEEAKSSTRKSSRKRAKVVASPAKVATTSPSKPPPVATTSVPVPATPSPFHSSRSKQSGSEKSLQIQLVAMTSRLQFLEEEIRRLQHVEMEVATLRSEAASMRANEELVKELRHQLDVRDQMIKQLLGDCSGAGKP
jgi:hypothetical protein